MRIFVRLITVLLVAALVLPLGSTAAQGPGTNPDPGSIGDNFYPSLGNSGYDARHYDLDLIVDVKQNALAGTATITALALEELRTFHLDFAGLSVDDVAINGTAVDWDYKSHELIAIPLLPVPADREFTVTVEYSGYPSGVEMTAIPFLIGWVNYGDGVFVASEPGGAASWYPVNDHPLDKATYTIRVTVPEPYVVASNGVLTDTINANGAITYVWEMRQPMASYLATVNIGAFERYEETGPGGLLIRNYFPPRIAEAAQVEFARTADMIAYFESVFGPYPFDAYGVVVSEANFSFALETQTLSLFSRAWISGTGAAEETVAHELAHQWFGNDVSLSQWHDMWLNEGFAVYASWLWFEHDRGAQVLDQIVRRTYSAIAEDQMTFVFQLSKQNLMDALATLPLGEMAYSASAAADLTRLLLQDSVTADDLEAFIAGFPAEDIGGRELELLLLSLPFDQAILNAVALDDFRALLGFNDVVVRHDYQIPASRYRAPGNVPPDDLFNRGVYQRGALALHALRLRVGDAAFFEILRTYYERFAGGNATIPDFIVLAQEISGEDLETFFDAWLYAADLPDIPEMDLSVPAF